MGKRMWLSLLISSFLKDREMHIPEYDRHRLPPPNQTVFLATVAILAGESTTILQPRSASALVYELFS